MADLKDPVEEVKMSGSLAYLKDKWTNEGHQDGWNEGHQDGWNEGHQDGWNEGHQDGWNEGQMNERNQNIYNHIQILIKNLQTTTAEALRLLNISETEYEAACKAVEKPENKA